MRNGEMVRIHSFRRPRTNTYACQQHAQMRLRQRYGLYLTLQDVQAIAGLVKDGKSTPLSEIDGYESTCTRSVHKVTFRDTEMIVVYSRKLKTLVTVLPPTPGNGD
jgi:hypothetical protein